MCHRRSAISNWISTSTLVGSTPIPADLGQTVTGAISNLYSGSTGSWTYIGKYNAPSSGSSTSGSIAIPSDLKELWVMTCNDNNKNSYSPCVIEMAPVKYSSTTTVRIELIDYNSGGSNRQYAICFVSFANDYLSLRININTNGAIGASETRLYGR